MKISLNITKFLILIGLSFFISFSASAKGKLTLYCIVGADVCEMIVQAFEKDAITLLID